MHSAVDTEVDTEVPILWETLRENVLFHPNKKREWSGNPQVGVVNVAYIWKEEQETISLIEMLKE
jgi:hypothetical protein